MGFENNQTSQGHQKLWKNIEYEISRIDEFGNLITKYNNDFKKAQIEYQNIRLDRIKLIHRKSINQAKLNHLKNPILVYLRNILMRFTGIISIRTNAIWSYKISKKL